MTREEFLLDEIEYYSSNVKKRCINSIGCFYSSTNVGNSDISEGCAIGRHLEPELRKKIDEQFSLSDILPAGESSSVRNDVIFNQLPEWMKELGQDFLVKCQRLHDLSTYWDESGLSPEGKSQLFKIIELFKLDKNKFLK